MTAYKYNIGKKVKTPLGVGVIVAAMKHSYNVKLETGELINVWSWEEVEKAKTLGDDPGTWEFLPTAKGNR